mmetsp:Transcript_13606/g.28845  ORF Transcript_13606/g.28845 Transcript_13606/m.28845 type:complete len:215 (+) Transcript_13606:659-1303(+)
MPHHAGRAVVIDVCHLPRDRTHRDLEQEVVVRVGAIPLDQWDHVEPRAVVHLPAVLHARAEGRQVLAIVADVAPAAAATVVRPRRTRPHVRQDVVDCLLGHGEVSKVHVPHHHLLLPRGVEPELRAVRIRRGRPVLLPHEHVGAQRRRVRGERLVRLAFLEQSAQHLPRDRAVHEADGRRAELEARLRRALEVPLPRHARGERSVPRDVVHRPV